jgi:hypothetical protein
MKKTSSLKLARAGAAFAAFLFVAGIVGWAQEKRTKPETIQAQAYGQLRATGKTFNVTILIESYSTPEDQKTLIDAFQRGGHDELVKTIAKMRGRGRVAITGTLGYQVAYVRSFPGPNGRTIRLITDRPIQFAETRASTRTKDYDLSAIELRIHEDPKKSEGQLIVAGKFKVDKDGQVTFESYGSGPWKLTNIMER